MDSMKTPLSNKYLTAFTIAVFAIPGQLFFGFMTYPAGSDMRGVFIILSIIELILCVLAYMAGKESGVLQGRSDSYDAKTDV
jgi:sugar phosphate permease